MPPGTGALEVSTPAAAGCVMPRSASGVFTACATATGVTLSAARNVIASVLIGSNTRSVMRAVSPGAMAIVRFSRSGFSRSGFASSLGGHEPGVRNVREQDRLRLLQQRAAERRRGLVDLVRDELALEAGREQAVEREPDGVRAGRVALVRDRPRRVAQRAVHEIGVLEVGILEIGVLEVRVLEVGVLEIGVEDRRVDDRRVLEVGVLEIGIFEVGILEVRIADGRVLQVRIVDLGVLEVRVFEIGILEVGVLEIGIRRIGIRGRSFPADRSAQASPPGAAISTTLTLICA